MEKIMYFSPLYHCLRPLFASCCTKNEDHRELPKCQNKISNLPKK